MVEPPHLRFDHKPASILLHTWHGDEHWYVGPIGMSLARMGEKDAISAIFFVEQGKRD